MIADDVVLDGEVFIPRPELVNLYGCRIGDGSRIGAFVEIRRNVVVGRNVKIQAFAFVPEGVVIEDGAFIGPHVCFTNDRYPRSVDNEGHPLARGDWKEEPTLVKEDASVGAGAIILCGVTIGRGSMVGAGAVVTRDVPDGVLVVGTPARATRPVSDRGNSV